MEQENRRSIKVPIGEREYLNAEEIAKWMGVSKKTIYEWRDEGLKYFRKKGRVFFSKKEVGAFLENYKC